MNLDRWMTETGATDEAFAVMVGVSRPTISRIRKGKRQPSLDVMRAIWEATAGAVTANDFVHGEAAAE